MGGYLIYTTFPEQHVFIDGRPDMYGQRILDDYMLATSLRPGWRQLLDSYDVRLVLVDKDGPLSVQLAHDPDWTELYTGNVERLFGRRIDQDPPELNPA